MQQFFCGNGLFIKSDEGISLFNNLGLLGKILFDRDGGVILAGATYIFR